jgi:hypothetical protein
MDERTVQPEVRSEPSSHPQDAPPLPPSPLAQVEPEGPPDVPLPWTAVPLGGVAGAIAGIVDWAIATASAGGPPLPPRVGAHQAGVNAAAALFIVLGAAISDRLAPKWPRGVRWACGMGVAGAASVGMVVSALCLLWAPAGGVSARQMVGLAASTVASTGTAYALFGAVLGLAAGSGRQVLWRLPLGGCGAMAAIMAAKSGLAVLGAQLPIMGSAYPVSGMALGLFVGIVMAERLNAARRGAMESGQVNGEGLP